MTKINVEQLPVTRQHEIVVVSITDAKDVGCDTIASAGTSKVILHHRPFHALQLHAVVIAWCTHPH